MDKASSPKSNSGFTIIEVVIALVLGAAVAGLGLNAGIDVYRSSNLSSDRDTLISSLERARNRAMTNVGESSHGVFLENDKYTIFRGASYALRDSEFDEELVSPSTVQALGTFEYAFEQLNGDAILSGTTTLRDDRGVERVITVNPEGRIDW
jgi:prepilin-type N-terminal cleavage/methylation domain-containing protein